MKKDVFKAVDKSFKRNLMIKDCLRSYTGYTAILAINLCPLKNMKIGLKIALKTLSLSPLGMKQC